MSGIKKYKSTFDGVEIKSGRRVGNSTRQINAAIEFLFDVDLYTVIVRDHYKNGSDTKANKYLLERIVQRLEVEHKINIQKLIRDKKLIIDKVKSTITLLET